MLKESIDKAYKFLSDRCPDKYRINEIISFGYPFRRIRININAERNPEKNLTEIYSLILQTLAAGRNTNEQLRIFLGLPHDDFLLKELYFLRENGLIALSGNEWRVMPAGFDFIKDNSILRVPSSEKFEFLIDGVTGDLRPYTNRLFCDSINKLDSVIKNQNRDAALVSERFNDISDVFKQVNENKAMLVDFANEIDFDRLEYEDYFLIEYIPVKKNDNSLEPYIEIRSVKEPFQLDKSLNNTIRLQYPAIIYKFSDSFREEINYLQALSPQVIPATKEAKKDEIIEYLTLWETKQKFIESIKTTSKILLIESPWIKKATLEYIPYFEELLKAKKTLIILYGIPNLKKNISNNDESVLDELNKLKAKYEYNFSLIYLPSFFNIKKISFSGSHIKTLIKDLDYYISGSYNFLSLKSNSNSIVSNEESHLIRKGVKERWSRYVKDYQLPIALFKSIL